MSGLVGLSFCLGGGAWIARWASLMGFLHLLLFCSAGCRSIGRSLSLGPGWRLLARLRPLSTCPQPLLTHLLVNFRTYRVQDAWLVAQGAPGLGKPEAALSSCPCTAPAAGTHMRST